MAITRAAADTRPGERAQYVEVAIGNTGSHWIKLALRGDGPDRKVRWLSGAVS